MNKIYATNTTSYMPISDGDQNHRQNEKNVVVPSEPTRSSSRRNQLNMKMASPLLISRSVRAKRRRAFLRTYQLSTLNNDSMGAVGETTVEPKYGEKVREVVIKIKLAMVSMANTARHCCFRPVICASLPASSSVRQG